MKNVYLLESVVQFKYLSSVLLIGDNLAAATVEFYLFSVKCMTFPRHFHVHLSLNLNIYVTCISQMPIAICAKNYDCYKIINVILKHTERRLTERRVTRTMN